MSGFSTAVTTATVSGLTYAPTSGTPGTGSFTPTNAAKGAPALMQFRVGGCYLFRFDDGAAWEIRWGFWTGTVVTRPTNGFVSSSTSSGLSLTSAASVTILSPLGLWQRGMGEHVASCVPIFNSSSNSNTGIATPTALGTIGSVAISDSDLLARQPCTSYTSATTASANGGLVCTTGLCSLNGGFHFTSRFGSRQWPTAPRLTVGLSTSTATSAVEPSTLTNIAMFAKDSTDANIQFMVNALTANATKQDTGLTADVDTLFEAAVWCDPGGTTMYGLLINYTTRVLWYGTAGSNLPQGASGLAPRCNGSLNGTNTGTALLFRFCGLYVRSGI